MCILAEMNNKISALTSNIVFVIKYGPNLLRTVRVRSSFYTEITRPMWRDFCKRRVLADAAEKWLNVLTWVYSGYHCYHTARSSWVWCSWVFFPLWLWICADHFSLQSILCNNSNHTFLLRLGCKKWSYVYISWVKVPPCPCPSQSIPSSPRLAIYLLIQSHAATCSLNQQPVSCLLSPGVFSNTWQLTTCLFKSSSTDRVHVHKSFRREIPIDDITRLYFFSPPPTSWVGGRLQMGAVIPFIWSLVFYLLLGITGENIPFFLQWTCVSWFLLFIFLD